MLAFIINHKRFQRARGNWFAVLAHYTGAFTEFFMRAHTAANIGQGTGFVVDFCGVQELSLGDQPHS